MNDDSPVFEVADLNVLAARQVDFVPTMRSLLPWLAKSPECLSFRLSECIEVPERYRMTVGWTRVEAHTVNFRASEGFGKWIEAMGPLLSGPPFVRHAREVLADRCAEDADIFEVAGLAIHVHSAERFEQAVAEAVTLVRSTAGCRSLALHRSIEHPGQYDLVVGWMGADAAGLPQSDGSAIWRDLIGHFLTANPAIHRFTDVISGLS